MYPLPPVTQGTFLLLPADIAAHLPPLTPHSGLARSLAHLNFQEKMQSAAQLVHVKLYSSY